MKTRRRGANRASYGPLLTPQRDSGAPRRWERGRDNSKVLVISRCAGYRSFSLPKLGGVSLCILPRLLLRVRLRLLLRLHQWLHSRLRLTLLQPLQPRTSRNTVSR